MKSPPAPLRRLAEIISHSVWLYHIFSPSLRDAELLLAKRGAVSSASPRSVGAGARNSAGALPTARATNGHHLGTRGAWMRCSSGFRVCSTACVVGQNGVVLDILVPYGRAGAAAKRLFQAPAEGSALCSAGRQADDPRRGKHQSLPEVSSGKVAI